ncbi:Basic-leucine zipper domain [Dillenia turbinata]|uniref:Basic-leucine zipper domain n=1 Tax=Dillenia turbinata TaxID=194707 RepID=A0AAN8VI38_9MAGN
MYSDTMDSSACLFQSISAIWHINPKNLSLSFPLYKAYCDFFPSACGFKWEIEVSSSHLATKFRFRFFSNIIGNMFPPILDFQEESKPNLNNSPSLVTSMTQQTVDFAIAGGYIHQENWMKIEETSQGTTTQLLQTGFASTDFHVNDINNVLNPFGTPNPVVGDGFGCFKSFSCPNFGGFGSEEPNMVLEESFRLDSAYPHELFNGLGTACGFEVHAGKSSVMNPRNMPLCEKIQRRMIKNRESAARSRARRQAQDAQNRLDIMKLKTENETLKKVIKALLAMVKANKEKQQQLARSFSGPLNKQLIEQGSFMWFTMGSVWCLKLNESLKVMNQISCNTTFKLLEFPENNSPIFLNMPNKCAEEAKKGFIIALEHKEEERERVAESIPSQQRDAEHMKFWCLIERAKARIKHPNIAHHKPYCKEQLKRSTALIHQMGAPVSNSSMVNPHPSNNIWLEKKDFIIAKFCRVCMKERLRDYNHLPGSGMDVYNASTVA